MKHHKAILYAGVFILLLGLSSLLGWIFHCTILISVIPGYASMKCNTALSFIGFGSLLLLLLTRRYPLLYYALAALVLLFNAVTLSEYIFHVNAGIDEFLIKDSYYSLPGNPHPRRMSISTAGCFLFLGASFLLIRKGAAMSFGQYLLHSVTLVSFFVIVGYLFDVPAFYKLWFLSSMALNTAIGLFLLSIAASLVNPRLGFTALFTGDKIGNRLARRLFPVMIALVLLLGFLRIQSHRLQWVSDESAIALSTTAFILIGLLFFWDAAKILNKIDDRRTEAERELQQTNDNLAATIDEKTTDLKNAHTDLMLLARRLQRQNNQLLNFAQITSHNLRAPVANLNSLRTLYDVQMSISEKDMLFLKFDVVIRQLSDTLNDLVVALRIQEDQGILIRRLHFAEVFEKVKDSLAGAISESAAHISVDFSRVETIEYPSEYLESILFNLLSNAIKYRSPHRVPGIHVQTAKDHDELILSVTDNGIGIDLSKYRPQLFGLKKVFHRHPHARGVGLFITKTQVEAMGGEIRVESEPDKGSRFSVIFNPKE